MHVWNLALSSRIGLTPAETFKTRAFSDFALFNHLIRVGAAAAGYADPGGSPTFPVKLGSGISV